MANTRKEPIALTQGQISFDLCETRTLLEIYKSKNIDPEKTAIVLALDLGRRVPITRYYDKFRFNDALKNIAEILRDQKPQTIYIGNVLVRAETIIQFSTKIADNSGLLY